MSPPSTSFAIVLKRYRLAAGLSQEALAERAGLSARAISDLERGVNRTPRGDTVRLLAEALALPPRQRALFAAAARPGSAAGAAAGVTPPHTCPWRPRRWSDASARWPRWSACSGVTRLRVPRSRRGC